MGQTSLWHFFPDEYFVSSGLHLKFIEQRQPDDWSGAIQQSLANLDVDIVIMGNSISCAARDTEIEAQFRQIVQRECALTGIVDLIGDAEYNVNYSPAYPPSLIYRCDFDK